MWRTHWSRIYCRCNEIFRLLGRTESVGEHGARHTETLRRHRRAGGAEPHDVVGATLRSCRRPLAWVAMFSGCIGVLSLTGSLYMLQLSDRVLASRSVPTLVALSLLAIAAYLLHGMLDALRCRMLARIGIKFGSALVGRIYDAMATLSLVGVRPAVATQAIADLDQVQRYLSGTGPTAVFDMPFLPIFFVVAFLMHPAFGWLIVAGGTIIIALAALSEMRVRGPTMAATISGAARHAIADVSFRNAAALKSMGMTRVFADNFAASNTRHATHHLAASDAAGGIGSIARAFRATLQSAVLGVGAYLTIEGAVSPGAMIAASILTARALAPVEVAVAHWRGLVAARQGYFRLGKLLREVGETERRIQLPEPHRKLTVQGLYVVAPGRSKPIVHNVSFEMCAGQGLAVIGPSASGKSTLARALIGVWPAARGAVCLDGASLEHWDSVRLGRHVGYLPQDIELFDGSVAENIARFDPRACDRDIIDAARTAGAHEMILGLEQSYETRIGDGGAALSAGQRQRVALARALYRDPFVVVLDEPNSNLDSEGDDALVEAMQTVRERGGIVIVITHRPAALAGIDLAAVMIGGKMQAFGRKEDILQHMTRHAITRSVGSHQARRRMAPSEVS